MSMWIKWFMMKRRRIVDDDDIIRRDRMDGNQELESGALVHRLTDYTSI